VLVFKDATGKTTIKVADFGYSTLAAGEAGKVLLPKSRQWNAPEHHVGEFGLPAAKKADVYSFGMLCLWVLFVDSFRDIPQTTTEGATELISFDAPLRSRTLLEQLKDEDKLKDIANQLMESILSLSTEHKGRLGQLFSLTVQLDPEKRTSDLKQLVFLLSQDR
jgi:serine/threonine protein kinase